MFRTVTALALSLTCVFAGFAQSIDSMINVCGENYPQEKIYVHFDKPAYNSGETIWFKAYLISGIAPSAMSKNFYAELIAPNGKVMQQKIFPVFEGSAAGSFELPTAPGNSSLIFRAYTTWMLNFDTSFLFSKTINILNKTTLSDSTPGNNNAGVIPNTEDTIINQKAPVVTLRFCPEGGDLVTGIESLVAFKAADKYGLPVAVHGVVKDTAGNAVAVFASQHDGMGSFVLKPEAGKTYYSEWQDEKQETHATILPPAKTTGVVLHSVGIDNHQSFVVRRSLDAPGNLKTLYLVAYFCQQVVYEARLNMKDISLIAGSIPLDSIPAGILQMTLFDANWQAQAERIAFVKKEDYLFKSEVTPALKNTGKRGKNTIVINVPGNLKTNLSIAITDAGASKTSPGADNIISHLLLTGDLRGYVHDPYYYFLGDNDSIRSHLDLVMLTNGWRRFKWGDLASGKLPTIKYPLENYLSLNANLYGVPLSQVPRNTQLNVIVEAKDSSQQLMILPMDSTGKFSQGGLIFFDTVRVYYQFNNNKELTNKATVYFTNGTRKENTFIKPDPAWGIPMPLDSILLNRGRFFAAETERIKPELDRKVKQLETIFIRGRQRSKQEQLDQRYTSGLFSGGDAIIFDLTDDPAALSSFDIFQYLQGRVAGLQIYPGVGMSGTRLVWRQAVPALFLNEVPVDVTAIETIPVQDIAYVKAFRPPFFGAIGGGPGGAIAIYTKKGGDSRSTSTVRGLEKEQLAGYAASKEFYSPDYTKDSPLNEVTDVRTTLYWEPYILTDAGSHKVTLEFYNNDVSERLRIVLEGMNEYGQLTRVEKVID